MVGLKSQVGESYNIFPDIVSHSQPKNRTLVGGFEPTPLKNISSSFGMMTFPIYEKNEKCPKAPTRTICAFHGDSNDYFLDFMMISIGLMLHMAGGGQENVQL